MVMEQPHRTVYGSTRARLEGSCYGVSLLELEGAAKPVATRSGATRDGTAWSKVRNLPFLMTQGRSRHSNKERVSKAEEYPGKEVTYN